MRGHTLVVGAPTRISDVGVESQHPDLVWAESGYGIAWRAVVGASIDILFARLDESGARLDNVELTALVPMTQDNPSLVWNGIEYGLAWRDSRMSTFQIYFARVDAAGVEVGTELEAVTTAGDSNGPSLAWNGGGYGVAWIDETTGLQVQFARLDPAGNRIGGIVQIGSTGHAFERVSLVWTGTEYGIAWTDASAPPAQIRFARLDATGAKVGADTLVSAAGVAASSPSLVWTGTSFAVAYDNCPPVVCPGGGTSDVHIARLDRAGSLLAPPARLSDGSRFANRPSLVWDGVEYAVAWFEAATVIARLDSDCALVEPQRAVNADGHQSWPSLAATPRGYALAWTDMNREIWFVELALE